MNEKERLSFVKEVVQKSIDKIDLPYQVVKKLLIKPEDSIELFYTIEQSQLEFYGVVRVNYEFNFKLPARLKTLISNRNICKLYLGTDFGLLRFYGKMPEQLAKGVVGSGEIPIELKFYKHICGVHRKAKGVMIASPGICNMCGTPIKAKKPNYNLLPCIKCGTPLVSKYCTNCGLKVAISNYLCSHCNQKLSYISLYKRWYCYKCEKYA